MPPKKKPSKNGFFEFMMKFKNDNGIKSMSEAQNRAGEVWKKLSKEERKPYQKAAESKRENFSKEKLTCEGVPLSTIEAQDLEKMTQVERMRHNIQMTINNAMDAGILNRIDFLIIHFNKLVYYKSADRYLVCEIAIAPFNLQNGVDKNNVFHRIIKPGAIPLGYFFEAKTYSENTHQLINIVYNDTNEEDNCEKVFFEAVDFMRKFQKGGKLPPLYTHEKDMEYVENVLNSWSAEFEFDEEISIYNLQYMFYILKNTVAGEIVWNTETYSFMLIDKDPYAYESGLSCEYHEEIDTTKYCSRCIAIRNAYIICENCTYELDIKLIPGMHVPLSVKMKVEKSEDDSVSTFSDTTSTTIKTEFDDGPSSSSSFNNFKPSKTSSIKNQAIGVRRGELINFKLPQKRQN